MSVPILKAAFVHGEVSPSMFGRFDLPILASAASTMRNFFVSYRGGALSRAGTLFVGFSKQTGRSYPPRLIAFQFSINQGLVLEFGNFYMRVISDGGFVTDINATITGATQSNPAVLAISGTGAEAASATSIPTGVSESYNPLDQVTLAGGTFTTAAVLQVTNTQLANLAVNAPGIRYVPGNTIHLTGGTQTTAAVLTVTATQVVSATVQAAGSGGPPGTNQTVSGTTGTGTKFTASVFIDGAGGIGSVNSIIFGGTYTTNPTNLAAEPVSGAGLALSALALTMGVAGVGITNAGVFTVNAPGGTFTQASTSGSGTGATFENAIFAPGAVSVTVPGVYSVFPANPVAQASTTGTGLGATFDVITSPIAITAFNNGDWVAISGVLGMTELNGETYVVGNSTPTSIQLFDVYGNPINSTAFSAYISGGVASRIYTVPTIYAEADLPWLKLTESNDVMSICCVNQQTLTEYESQDLTRASDIDFSFAAAIPTETAQPPASLSGSASSSGSVDYEYVATAVNPADGTESIASEIATITSAVDIASTAGTITLTLGLSPTQGVNEYNIYKATPAYDASTPPTGALFGYAGSCYGAQFLDTNIVADFTQVPPTHQNPFARGQILGAKVINPGSGSSFTVTINSTTGTDAVLVPIVVSDALVGFIDEDAGMNYQLTDTMTLNNGATATLIVGPESGTYPGVPFYFQERRGYAYSLNNPDTYWMSQPGSFTNFDFRIPTIDSDAITGSPWSIEVNGIQWCIQAPAGLLVLTGLSAWLLVGTGSFATNVQAISPSSQVANPQPFTGCSPTVPPIKINYDIIYVQAQGSIYLDLPYQLYTLSEPIDLTQFSSHLFTDFTIIEHAWCEIPNKVLWAVRSDGVLLSLTFLKAQEVAGWGRHDTQGLFQSVCSVIEPPVNALYLAVQRFPGANTAYMIERMDNRIWNDVEDTWCVDCGLTLPQPTPAATLTASSATGLGSCIGVTGIVGGKNYSAATTAVVIDAPMTPNQALGPGTGATVTLTIVGGAITGYAFPTPGAGYLNPQLVYSDPANTGSGAAATVTLNNTMTFMASAAIFSSGNVGSVIRSGGGIASITGFTDTQHVVANMLSPIVDVYNDGTGTLVPQPQTAGNWSMTAPVSTVSGLNYLAGATVTGLADGNVIPPTVVSAQGTIALATPASAITVGLGFQAQLQSVYLDAGTPTVQGQRRKIAEVVLRVQNSRGLKVGVSQPDGSTLSPPQIAPPWYEGIGGLTTVPDIGPNFPRKPYNALATPLLTGDINVPSSGGFDMRAQIAVQQDNPLPAEILALIPSLMPGDTPQLQAPKQQARQ